MSGGTRLTICFGYTMFDSNGEFAEPCEGKVSFRMRLRPHVCGELCGIDNSSLTDDVILQTIAEKSAVEFAEEIAWLQKEGRLSSILLVGLRDFTQNYAKRRK